MPNTHYRKVTRAIEQPKMTIFRSEDNRFRRRWLCPGEMMIAAYSDGALGKWRKALIEFHLAGCERCRLTVGYLVKAQREADVAMPSADLLGRAVGSGRRPSYGRHWQWAAAGALAGIVILAVVPAWLHKTGRVAVAPPTTPAVPLIAKSEPVPRPGSPTQEHSQVRGPQSFHLLPTVIAPRPESVVATGTPQFSWNPIPKSHRYEVQVLRSDGDPVWKGETDKSALQIPSEGALSNGAYFVWITAYLENGALARSAPVRFQVKR